MTYGLRRAGINVIAGIDNDEACRRTYEANNPGSNFVCHDISDISPACLAKEVGIGRHDDELVFIGCSPCQYWSLIKSNKTNSLKTAFLLEHFQNFVDYFRPGYIIIENVPGILKKANSPLDSFRSSLLRWGYRISEEIVNANDFGVPQNRRRFVMIASRINSIPIPVSIPKKRKTVADAIGAVHGFPPITAGERHSKISWHIAASLSETNLKRIENTPKNGGTRKSWKGNPELQLETYKDRDDQFGDVYGRMYWDKPSPTITTRYISISNGRFAHPEENRGISVREGACLQSFPKSYKIIASGIQEASRLIGNAVPPKLAEALGKAILDGSR